MGRLVTDFFKNGDGVSGWLKPGVLVYMSEDVQVDQAYMSQETPNLPTRFNNGNLGCHKTIGRAI